MTSPRRRRFARGAVLAALSVLIVSGCTGGDVPGAATPADHLPGGSALPGQPDPSASSPASEVLASTMETSLANPARLDVLALDRTANDTVTLRFRVTNLGVGTQSVTWAFHRHSHPLYHPSNVTLLDTANHMRHYPFRTQQGACFCSALPRGGLAPQESAEAWLVYPAPPARVERMTVLLPPAAPFFDLPLGSSGRAEEPPGPLAEPEVRDLRFIEDDPGGGAREQTGDDVSVMLSSDVLFATNESTLTSRAVAALGDVARQIDVSGGSAVRVEGHTDNTGTEAINGPLSEARAATVRDVLDEMVTVPVTFETAGHGAGAPVASNESAEGRARNRRVTVTFQQIHQPQQQPAPSPPPPTPAAAQDSVLGTLSMPPDDHPGMFADVRGFTRSRDGYVALRWRLRNDGAQQFNAAYGFPNPVYVYSYAPAGESGVVLTDPVGGTTYHPIMDTSMVCLCSTTLNNNDEVSYPLPGQEVPRWNLYRIAADVRAVDVTISRFDGAAADVPVP